MLETPAMAAKEKEAAAAAELAELLSPAAGQAAREGAAEAALALSGDAAGRRLLAGQPAAMAALLELAAGPSLPAARHALGCLVNLSAEPAAREPLLAALPALLGLLPGGPACGVLANLCRERGAARRVLRGLREGGPGLEPLLQALGQPRPPSQLGPLLCNLSQLPEGRRGLLDRSRCSVQRLLPFTQYQDSVVHRRGVVGALRNCCFEYEDHEWLLSEEVDILPFLLLPLAGPEEFPEDEMERLPVDLQYLPQDKQREEEPDIRKMLLEAIMLMIPSWEERLVHQRVVLASRETSPGWRNGPTRTSWSSLRRRNNLRQQDAEGNDGLESSSADEALGVLVNATLNVSQQHAPVVKAAKGDLGCMRSSVTAGRGTSAQLW
ncbi:protein HGH1 homolog isoform X1 [Harpia harpyja]|uniref:protein HGH1 homolog isoform X1 n=1 Tax=Harpia harpyja TaxID=202280 RepID=UPI0022B0F8DF|nr:protein HGH1 homolog isoform X1 [Harpia harpyja]